MTIVYIDLTDIVNIDMTNGSTENCIDMSF